MKLNRAWKRRAAALNNCNRRARRNATNTLRLIEALAFEPMPDMPDMEAVRVRIVAQCIHGKHTSNGRAVDPITGIAHVYSGAAPLMNADEARAYISRKYPHAMASPVAVACREASEPQS